MSEGIRGRTDRPPRALLAWEYGAGHTHVANIVGVARHLREAGVDCLATLHDLRAAPALAALGVPVVQNHVWPNARRWARHDRERPYRAFIDRLGNLGLANADAVAAALAHYDGLLSLFAPNVILAENAYGAHLAARGRVPVLAFGFGEFLPPAECLAEPEEPGSWGEEEVLAGLNEGLRRAARAPLVRLADLFVLDATLPFGPGAFDRHASRRSAPPLPAHVPGFRSGMRAGEGEELFVYLEGAAAGGPAILAALVTVGWPIRAHLPDVDPDARAVLEAAGVALEDDVLPIARILETARAVLHHGGVGLAAACLAAGLPQVVLSRQLDNRTAGDFVAGEGLGLHERLDDATAEWIAEASRTALDDGALRARCRRRAPDFDGWFAADPTRIVADEALRLLGRPPARG